MAKPLVVEFGNEDIPLSLEKIDRTKLYGYVDTEVVDESGKKCDLVTIAGDGQTLISKGGTALGYMSPDGQWRKKADLVPVDIDSIPIIAVRSTFDSPVKLDKTATVDEFLSHNITSIYLLAPEEGAPLEPLMDELKKGTIYSFPFSFRGGLEAHAGFLLLGSDGNLFLLVGVPTKLEFVGLNQPAPVVPDETLPDEAEDDLLDFSLV